MMIGIQCRPCTTSILNTSTGIRRITGVVVVVVVRIGSLTCIRTHNHSSSSSCSRSGGDR